MSATTQNGHGKASEARRALRREEPPREAPAAESRSRIARLTGALTSLPRAIAGRVPPADLDERDPHYIRRTPPRPWRARPPLHPGDAAAPLARLLALVPRRGPRPRQRARIRPGAAGRQPL